MHGVFPSHDLLRVVVLISIDAAVLFNRRMPIFEESCRKSRCKCCIESNPQSTLARSIHQSDLTGSCEINSAVTLMIFDQRRHPLLLRMFFMKISVNVLKVQGLYPPPRIINKYVCFLSKNNPSTMTASTKSFSIFASASDELRPRILTYIRHFVRTPSVFSTSILVREVNRIYSRVLHFFNSVWLVATNFWVYYVG